VAAFRWDAFDLPGTLRGRTLGIVGLGDIGRDSGKIAKEGFGMQARPCKVGVDVNVIQMPLSIFNMDNH
jgi:lactate dehydrogenase-like 2-hydroxyacid dehydrogenase